MVNNVQFLVIGGGAAGLMAGKTAAENGIKTLIVEKGPEPGRKLNITGGGRGNFTNLRAWDDETVFSRPEDAKRLKALGRLLPVPRLRTLFHEIGVSSKEEDEGRIFPRSDKASDLTKALQKAFLKAGGSFVFNEDINKIRCDRGVFEAESMSGKLFRANNLLAASGGASYPHTGSSGSGLIFAEQLGLEYKPFGPALCSLNLREGFPARLEGISLDEAELNYELRAEKGRRSYKVSRRGPILWQKKGLSGPLILNASADLYESGRLISAELNFLPNETSDSLQESIAGYAAEFPKRRISSWLRTLLPQRPADFLYEKCFGERAADERLNFANFSKQDRHALINLLLHFPLEAAAPPPLRTAMACRGGILPDEINWRTMESKKLPGLYFAGELIDIDFISGGFHLTFAFQSGYAAAAAVCSKIRGLSF